MKLQPSNQKIIHYRLRLYVHDALQEEFRKLLLITVDSDVVAVTLYYFFYFILKNFQSNVIMMNIEGMSQNLILLAFK